MRRDPITGRIMPDPRTPDDRLRASVMADPNSGCWLWTGATDEDGYGVAQLNGTWMSAHRAAYSVYCGTIPRNALVLHRCDVRCCINPAHLFLGNNKDNMADMYSKGRQRWSKNNLAAEQVREIKRLYKAGESVRSITRRFDVSRVAIKKVIRNQSYRDVIA